MGMHQHGRPARRARPPLKIVEHWPFAVVNALRAIDKGAGAYAPLILPLLTNGLIEEAEDKRAGYRVTKLGKPLMRGTP